MAAAYHAPIPSTPLSRPNPTPRIVSLQRLSHSFTSRSHKINFGCKFSWNYGKSFNLYASSSSSGNGLEAKAAAASANEYLYEDDEFIVVNFYRFVFVEDPQEDRNIRGRIYLNEQGINAQYSGPSKEALAYVDWVKEDHRFSDILVQISPAINGHAFPKLKLRYKPSLLEEGISHLPLLDPSMRATPLKPSEWRSKLEEANKIGNSSDTANSNFILLDVRNGYEWDVGHFQGAQRPDVRPSDPLADADKEKTDVLMYCTGGIRCDVYSTILRQQGFKRLYTLEGGVSHYLENEGPIGWTGNLFVFDARLSLPPSTYKPEIRAEATEKQEESHSFAKCYVCGSQVSELRHRNCANLDCNLLFLCCLECVDDFRGCCCMKCTSAPRLRPVLPGHQRYDKWHTYRDLELQNSSSPASPPLTTASSAACTHLPLMLPRLWSRRKFQLHGNLLFSTLRASLSQAPPEIISANRKISELIRGGRLGEARAFFDSLWQRNTVTWNSMLSGYVKRREIANARVLFDEMPERDRVSWNLMILGYMSCRGRRYVEEGRHLFDQMPERDVVSWNTMISGYAKNGRIDDAFRLFDCMPEKNVVTWNAMITGFLDNGDVKRACELFKGMPERDAASLSVIVSGLMQNDDLDEAEKVLLEYGKVGEVRDDLVHAYNTLIAGYGQKGRVEDARRLFDQIPQCSDRGSGRNSRFERNVVSWNSMIMSYVKARDMASANELFNEMENRDNVTWNTMISGYVNASNMEAAMKLFYEMRTPDALSWNSIISGFAQAGKMELALDFFRRMPQKNRVSWNTMIAGYEKNGGFKEAMELFVCMQVEGEKPDRHTLSSLLSICAESAAHHMGIQIHQLVSKTFIPDIALYNSLITMYARCGVISEARAVFDEMKSQKNVISWNAMIGGYAAHGFAREALELFETMKRFRVKPTYITFISVLSACSHGGLVEEGRLYFRSMVEDFGIEPRVEHFSSLVDVVGRHGKLEEAMDMINRMPVEPDKAVWGALMGACRVHNNVELARIAAEALMKLEPESSGPYVLLYNMYADAERWNDADEIRMIMDKRSVKKERGYSKVDSSYW
ncbi:mitochondrial editing factor 9 [Perilla frutescens var. hirtella]|nr:mitochondrial editing factor 9 [Perilla frutescens var. hirtella]